MLQLRRAGLVAVRVGRRYPVSGLRLTRGERRGVAVVEGRAMNNVLDLLPDARRASATDGGEYEHAFVRLEAAGLAKTP